MSRNEVRIIAGGLRGRKLFFPKVAGLRPTPSLVRETLFNWLRDEVEGASVLDLFAGSGALGFEAVSRGAKKVVAVESHPQAARALVQSRAILEAEQVEIIACEAVRYLRHADPSPFDLVFLDPPFGKGLVGVCCALLEQRGWLKANAKIYVEAERRLIPEVPANWEELRAKRVGEVGSHLYRRM